MFILAVVGAAGFVLPPLWDQEAWVKVGLSLPDWVFLLENPLVRASVSAVGVCFFVLALYYLFVRPAHSQSASMKQDVTRLESEINDLKGDLCRVVHPVNPIIHVHAHFGSDNQIAPVVSDTGNIVKEASFSEDTSESGESNGTRDPEL